MRSFDLVMKFVSVASHHEAIGYLSLLAEPLCFFCIPTDGSGHRCTVCAFGVSGA